MLLQRNSSAPPTKTTASAGQINNQGERAGGVLVAVSSDSIARSSTTLVSSGRVMSIISGVAVAVRLLSSAAVSG